jgi:hypothetical protein
MAIRYAVQINRRAQKEGPIMKILTLGLVFIFTAATSYASSFRLEQTAFTTSEPTFRIISGKRVSVVDLDSQKVMQTFEGEIELLGLPRKHTIKVRMVQNERTSHDYFLNSRWMVELLEKSGEFEEIAIDNNGQIMKKTTPIENAERITVSELITATDGLLDQGLKRHVMSTRLYLPAWEGVRPSVSMPLGGIKVRRLLGDVNDDTIVDIRDLNEVRNNMGSRTQNGDADLNGTVQPADLNIVQNQMGKKRLQ